MTKVLGVLVAACLAVCAVDAAAGPRSRSVQRVSTQLPPTFVGPGVTLAIHEVTEDVTAGEAGVLAVSVTLANIGGVPLNLRFRDFVVSADGDERYPALLPSELGATPPSEVMLREGVLGTGESTSAVLYFRAPSLRSPTLELCVALADLHDTPIAEAILPILRTPGSSR